MKIQARIAAKLMQDLPFSEVKKILSDQGLRYYKDTVRQPFRAWYDPLPVDEIVYDQTIPDPPKRGLLKRPGT